MNLKLQPTLKSKAKSETALKLIISDLEKDMRKLFTAAAGSFVKTLLPLSAILIAVSIFAARDCAQNARNTDYKADQSLKSNATVNPSTLAMELSIPVGGYAGRGGGGVPVKFDYSSKLWHIQAGVPFSSNNGVVTPTYPQYADRTAAGWKSSLGVPRIDTKSDIFDGGERDGGQGAGYTGQVHSSYESEQGGTFSQYPLYWVKRLHVEMPDGSTHEMRTDDAVVNCGNTQSGCTQDLNGTYLAVDGSKLRLEFSLTQTSTLFLPDGSRYLFGAVTGTPISAATYIDRNGNRMDYNAANRYWTDTMGRVISDPLPLNWDSQAQTVGDVTASFPGFGTGTTGATFSWRYLKDPNNVESGLTDSSQELAFTSNIYCQGNVTHQYSTTYPTAPHLFTSSDSDIKVCGPGSSSPGARFNPVVLTKITLANGQSYQFKYNLYGEIEKVIYPTGAYERFHYDTVATLQGSGIGAYDQANRGVTDRWVSEKGDGTDERHWTYQQITGVSHQAVIAPDGTRTEQYIYTEPVDTPQPFGFGDAKTGRAYDERTYSPASTTNQLLTRHLTEYGATQTTLSGYGVTATRDLRPTREISIIFEPNNSYALMTMTETVYDTSGSTDAAYFSSLNPKQTKTYHYVALNASTAATATFATLAASFSASNLAATTETDYLYDSNYKARNITGLAAETRIKDAAGNVKAKTQIVYDDAANYPLISAGTNGQWTDPNTNYRGNANTMRSWTDTANNLYTETHARFDNFGNLREATDARGNVSSIAYSSTYAYAYPTSTTSAVPDASGANGSAAALTTSTVYDYNTGLPTSVTDANGQTSTMEYADALYRPTKVTAANGQQTISEYGAGTSVSTRYLKTKTQIDAANWKEALAWYDGLGRNYKTQTVDAVSGDEFALTCYDQMGRVSKVSNPFRNVSNPTCSTTSLEWTTSTYDDQGRATKVTTADNAEVNTAYELAASGADIGTAVTVTDQAGKSRRSITNALGQLKRVDEPNDSNQLGTISSPNQATSYSYDTLNNLTTVNQGSQTRTFAYDALSRLKQAVNPESGTISYIYDNNGNLTQKTDARSVVTSYAYDALNRIKTRTYSGEAATQTATPNVSYYYDNLTNAKGKLIKVSSANSTTEYTAFDILGRVTGHKQTTDGNQYATTYTYNLSGALLEETYPNGRVVRNTLDANGELAQVSSQKNSNFGFQNYAGAFSYTAAGATSSMRLGNGKWESTQFNSRLQPTEIRLGNVQNANNLLNLVYTYNTTGNTDNNGNVLTQKIKVENVGAQNGFEATQTYTYDSLNRIKDATENSVTNGQSSSVQTWKQTFTYDRYGNRTFDEANTTTLPKNCGTSPSFTVCTGDRKVVNPTPNASDNRLSSNDNYAYDYAGNTTADAQGRTFIYDAENKQTEVKDSSSVSLGQYKYDGDGKRVKKVSAAEETIFVYDASGKMIAEYSTALNPTPQVSYLTSDHLGSPRINTDEKGAVISRHDYQPFGEEITQGRNTGLQYQDDMVRKQFTGYEKDAETDLDFAQARMYANKLGRFNSADPILSSGKPNTPQSWNRYNYVLSNPLRLTDPTGMFAWSEALGGNASNEDLKAAKKAADKAKNKTEFNRLKTILNRREAVVSAISEARVAAQGLNSKDKNKVEAALKNYGEPGIDNGVTVGIADESTITTAGGFTQVNNANQIQVAFFENQLDHPEGTLFTAVAHEGYHIGVAKNWLANNKSPNTNETLYQAEFNGYTISSLVAQGENRKLESYTGTELWNPSWAITDKKVLESRRAGINAHLQNLGLYDGQNPTQAGLESALPGKNLKVK